MDTTAPPLSATRPRPWREPLRKYYNIFQVSLIERLTYRGDFLLSTVLRFLPVATTILLWEAIYAGADRPEISGFTRHQMIAYLLLIHISRMFSSMPGLAAGIARDIRDGSLKKYLLQPLDMICFLLASRAAHKAAYISTSALPYAGLFLVCISYFDGFPGPLTFLAFLVSLLLGFVIGFFFEACLGMCGFWFLEISSLLWIVGTITYFVSGQMVPLDVLPVFWQKALLLLPFQYLGYFPAVIFLGKVQGTELLSGLGLEVVWAAVFILLTRWLYALGLRHYSAFGG